jgi:predicted O-linked N-acetylglucosamine transferase (SPINDLY family)
MAASGASDRSTPERVDDIVAALERGETERARGAARRNLVCDPADWVCWHLASLAAVGTGVAPGIAPFRRATDLAGDRGELWASLAAVLEGSGRPAAALRAGRRALALLPAAGEAAINLSAALKDCRHAAAAAAWLDRAAHLLPGNAVVRNNRGLLHLAAEDAVAAAASFRAAIAAAPAYADAYLNLAIAERRLGRLSAAAGATFTALRLSPADAGFLAELGTLLVAFGESRAGLVWLRRALATSPGNAAATASLLGALAYVPDLDEAERRAAYGKAEAQAEQAAQPRLPPATPLQQHAGGRMTLGYVSGSFRSHPMAQQLIALLDHHDRSRFRIVAYADGGRGDALTERLRGAVDRWVDTTAMSDAEAAAAIRADAVDVLMFLALHEQGARRALPCHRAAPLQVSLHDIATSGLAAMDAWITDPLLHPPQGTSEWFSERLIRVPNLFLFSELTGAAVLPRPVGDGPLTFASFSNPAKLSLPTLSAWAEILRRVPNSTLLLKYQRLPEDAAVLHRIREALAAARIDPARLRLHSGALHRDQHLVIVGSTDIVLDPFPYNGNTATIEALWMGVPVVTLAGSRFIGRMGLAILNRVGLGDLVAADVDEYVAAAATLAGDRARRIALRSSLRDGIRASVLFDAIGYARHLEAELMHLVRR